VLGARATVRLRLRLRLRRRLKLRVRLGLGLTSPRPSLERYSPRMREVVTRAPEKRANERVKPKSTCPTRISSDTRASASSAATWASSGLRGRASHDSSALSRSSAGRSRRSCGLGSDGNDGRWNCFGAAPGFAPALRLAAGHRAAALRGLAFLALLLPPGRPFGGARKADPVWPLSARKAASTAMARRILVLIFRPSPDPVGDFARGAAVVVLGSKGM